MTVAFTRRPRAIPVDPQPLPSTWKPYFGTDGIRGLANHELTPILAVRVGRAVASTVTHGDGRIVVAQDTRRSGDMLVAGLVAGITSMGVDAVTLGVAPTAALAHIAARWRYAAGIMVSASHNPAEDNGLKVFDGDGCKLDEHLERRLESLILRADALPVPGNHGMGAHLDGTGELDRYRAHRLAIARRLHARLRVVVDCANGSASSFAGSFLEAAGAQVTVTEASPTGCNINNACGATSPAALAEHVRQLGADVGFALDGDADRCVVVDHRGSVVDGDALLGLLALDRLRHDRLSGRALVVTQVSNGGLEGTLAPYGGRVHRTPVGDRHVWAGMVESNAVLGGERSGHVIIRHHAQTGDGMVTALEVLEVMARTGRTIADLAADIILWPQQERSVRVADRAAAIIDPVLDREISLARGRLGGAGRILVRPSGTEPLVRIMVEGPDRDHVTTIADGLADLVRQRQPQS
ncbi:MAG: phosphoglucosamine mutase [Chloroflexota bacterium]